MRAKADHRRAPRAVQHIVDIHRLQQGWAQVAELLDLLEETEGEAGFRMLFDEVARASPELVARLDERDMLLRYPLDLDRALARWYPEINT